MLTGPHNRIGNVWSTGFPYHTKVFLVCLLKMSHRPQLIGLTPKLGTVKNISLLAIEMLNPNYYNVSISRDVPIFWKNTLVKAKSKMLKK